MTLTVHTARLTYGGPDRFDITRKGDHPDGVVFAPSWEILNRYRGAGKSPDAAWAAYVPEYTREMRVSFVEHRRKWKELLARESVTLVCFCFDPLRCHRTLLAEILRILGANVVGERPAEEQKRVRA